jgi:hypothetical protein
MAIFGGWFSYAVSSGVIISVSQYNMITLFLYSMEIFCKVVPSNHKSYYNTAQNLNNTNKTHFLNCFKCCVHRWYPVRNAPRLIQKGRQ